MVGALRLALSLGLPTVCVHRHLVISAVQVFGIGAQWYHQDWIIRFTSKLITWTNSY